MFYFDNFNASVYGELPANGGTRNQYLKVSDLTGNDIDLPWPINTNFYTLTNTTSNRYIKSSELNSSYFGLISSQNTNTIHNALVNANTYIQNRLNNNIHTSFAYEINNSAVSILSIQPVSRLVNKTCLINCMKTLNTSDVSITMSGGNGNLYSYNWTFSFPGLSYTSFPAVSYLSQMGIYGSMYILSTATDEVKSDFQAIQSRLSEINALAGYSYSYSYSYSNISLNFNISTQSTYYEYLTHRAPQNKFDALITNNPSDSLNPSSEPNQPYRAIGEFVRHTCWNNGNNNWSWYQLGAPNSMGYTPIRYSTDLIDDNKNIFIKINNVSINYSTLTNIFFNLVGRGTEEIPNYVQNEVILPLLTETGMYFKLTANDYHEPLSSHPDWAPTLTINGTPMSTNRSYISFTSIPSSRNIVITFTAAD